MGVFTIYNTYDMEKNPFAIIINDHREVQKLFKEFEELGDRALKTKQDIADEIVGALTIHAAMEEKLLYPLLEAKFEKEGKKMVEEAYAEHGVAKNLIAVIKGLDPEDPQFDAQVKVLMEMVNHHIEEEEKELLPKAEREMSEEEMNILGQQMEHFKEQ